MFEQLDTFAPLSFASGTSVKGDTILQLGHRILLESFSFRIWFEVFVFFYTSTDTTLSPSPSLKTSVVKARKRRREVK